MNELQEAAFELRIADLKRLIAAGHDAAGGLLAASSAYDPDPSAQREAIRLLIGAGVPVNEADKNGVTPLHRAVRFRSPAAAEELITHGADVNAADKRSRATPLHRTAVSSGAPATAGKTDAAIRLAELLLAHGADPQATNKSGQTPGDLARDQQLRAVLRAERA
ncbi:Ankyrin repeat protein [Posidoniimonas corsicana]|uniref:Ankyrin repeat protein n=1 Tax=Posidoniimonas corsicana TaxID=1938618 RepID=A0A5C5V4Y7_9BACT|nr:ankyrin repeat domain-containing protein [Posidoniimonas corsicana]TWT33598.1 Ankyrin repeat protein [Posidoniimonas corsicana]